jgi:glucokinase
LKWLPYGGLYIGGAIAPQNLQRLRSDTTFIDAYYDKGRVNPLMRQVSDVTLSTYSHCTADRLTCHAARHFWFLC